MVLSMAFLLSEKRHKCDEMFIIHNGTSLHNETSLQTQMNNTGFKLRFVVIVRQFPLYDIVFLKFNI